MKTLWQVWHAVGFCTRKAERRHIAALGATPEGRAEGGSWAMFGYVLRSRKVWGLTIGFACYGYSIALYLSWLPNYLVRTMHMGIMKSAGYTVAPRGGTGTIGGIMNFANASSAASRPRS